MKIAFMLPGGGFSGGIRVTVVEANYLLKRGHKVRILVKKRPTSPRVIYRYLRDYIIHSAYSAHSWLEDFLGKIEYFGENEECKFDNDEIIVGVGIEVTGQMVKLNSLPNAKIQYIHGATPWTPDLEKQALSLPVPKIVVSSYLKALAESYGGDNVMAVIPNGIDQAEYYCSVNDSQRNGIGTIYSSSGAKDPRTILACIEKMRRDKPEVPIRVFGVDRRPKQVGRHFYWRFPSVEKAREIYSKSLVWIIASMSEGFSSPVLEAMACGAVPVATDCGGTKDIIADGENGLLAKVGDVDQIVDRALILLKDKQRRNRMQIKAEETVGMFTWDRTIDALENALRKL